MVRCQTKRKKQYYLRADGSEHMIEVQPGESDYAASRNVLADIQCIKEQRDTLSLFLV